MKSRGKFAVVAGVVAVVSGIAPLEHTQAHAAASPVVDHDARVLAAIPAGAERTIVHEFPFRVNTVALSFVRAPGTLSNPEILVSARTGDGWSPETDLHVTDDEAPDPREAATASPRTFTPVLWAGLTDAIRVRVEAGDAAVTDVRVHAANVRGDAVDRSLLQRGWSSVVRWLTATRVGTEAGAYPGRPGIIMRRQWGANESWRSSGPGVASHLRMVFIHHTTNSNSYSRSDSAAIVRGIYRYHTRTRGYSDIAYNFLIDRYGQIFEGRAGGIDRAVIGGHTGGLNAYSSGVALIGTFTSSSPPSRMRYALTRLLAWKMDIHHIPIYGKVLMVSSGGSKYPSGTRVWLNRISGHRDGSATSCPGSKTYALLPAIRKAVHAYGVNKIFLPTPPGSTLRPDGDGAHETFTISATFSRRMAWKLRFADIAGIGRAAFTGTGTSMRVSWDGTWNGRLVKTGVYRWTLSDRSTGTTAARPATGILYFAGRHTSGATLVDGEGTYVIDGSVVRDVSPIVAQSWYPNRTPVVTGPAERGWFSAGTALAPRAGTLFLGPDDARYIYSAGLLRPFDTDPDTFTALGYDDAAAIEADASFLSSLTPGPEVTDLTIHPDGTVVRAPGGEMFVLDAGTRRPLTLLARQSRYRANEVVTATGGDLALPVGSAMQVLDGTLLADPWGSRHWIVENGQRRKFTSAALPGRLGYSDSMLLFGSVPDFEAIPAGPPFA